MSQARAPERAAEALVLLDGAHWVVFMGRVRWLSLQLKLCYEEWSLTPSCATSFQHVMNRPITELRNLRKVDGGARAQPVNGARRRGRELLDEALRLALGALGRVECECADRVVGVPTARRKQRACERWRDV